MFVIQLLELVVDKIHIALRSLIAVCTEYLLRSLLTLQQIYKTLRSLHVLSGKYIIYCAASAPSEVNTLYTTQPRRTLQ
jgi:hypothetical protein